MFEVVPSPARKRPSPPSGASRGSRARAAALLALLPAAQLGGCGSCGGPSPAPDAAIPDAGADAPTAVLQVPPGPTPSSDYPGLPAIDLACVAGTWVTAPVACACPPASSLDHTAECGAKDCHQTAALFLQAGGQAIRASVRFSKSKGTLSAVGGKAISGEWKYFDDAELMLKFEGNAKYTPTECQGDDLIPKGEAPLSAPPPPLLAALTWAELNDHWTAVPYSE